MDSTNEFPFNTDMDQSYDCQLFSWHSQTGFEENCITTRSTPTFGTDQMEQELRKLILDRIPNCYTCTQLVLQLIQHIRSKHPETLNHKNDGHHDEFLRNEEFDVDDFDCIFNSLVGVQNPVDTEVWNESSVENTDDQLRNVQDRVQTDEKPNLWSSSTHVRTETPDVSSTWITNPASIERRPECWNYQNSIASIVHGGTTTVGSMHDPTLEEIPFEGYSIEFGPVKELSLSPCPVIPTRQNGFECDICHKHSSSKAHLKIHYRIHTGERPFKCTVCNKSFTVKSALQCHMRTHTGEKPYICLVCNRAFAHSTAVTSHMKVHTKEKNFLCSLCNITFVKCDSLVKHMGAHTGEKPYECNICHKAFRKNTLLKLHIRRNHTPGKR